MPPFFVMNFFRLFFYLISVFSDIFFPVIDLSLNLAYLPMYRFLRSCLYSVYTISVKFPLQIYFLFFPENVYSLRDIQSIQVRSLPASMRALASDYRSRMITLTLSAEYNLTISSLANAFAAQDDRKVLKKIFKMILLDCHHLRSTVCQLKVEEEHKWTERPLHVTQVLCRDARAVGQADAIKL